jgi:hypothetical protein
VSLHTVFRAEKGHNIQTNSLKLIAAALNTSIGYLTGETDDPGPPLRYYSEITPTNMVPVIDAGDLSLEGMQLGSEIIALRQDVQPKPSAKPPADLAPLKTGGGALVKVLPKGFAACCGSGVDWGDEAIDFDFEYIDPDPDLARHSPLIAMYVIGDSMEPDIEEDDLVLFSESDIDYAPNGSIVVANYEGRMIVRGLFRKPDRVVLKAWNRDYEDIEVKLHEELRICGVVLRIDKSKKPRPML